MVVLRRQARNGNRALRVVDDILKHLVIRLARLGIGLARCVRACCLGFRFGGRAAEEKRAEGEILPFDPAGQTLDLTVSNTDSPKSDGQGYIPELSCLVNGWEHSQPAVGRRRDETRVLRRIDWSRRRFEPASKERVERLMLSFISPDLRIGLIARVRFRARSLWVAHRILVQILHQQLIQRQLIGVDEFLDVR